MSVYELGYRCQQMGYASLQRYGLMTAKKTPVPDDSQRSMRWLATKATVAPLDYIRSADQLLVGEMRIFSLENGAMGEVPEWNRDPRTGIVAPLVFGKSLDYRDVKLVGDIKYLWEPNRHLQLVRIAQAYALSQDRRYLVGLAKQLNSWFEQCPYLMGPNWTSSLELAIRLINWSIVWQLIGGRQSVLFQDIEGQQLLDKWLESIYKHCHFIRGHMSRYSSANNHLIGEAAGLFIATLTWPYWRNCQRWKQYAFRILETEAVKQNTTDGVNLEQAISYQQFVLDFFILAGLAGKTDNLVFSSRYWQRIECMLEFIASMMDVDGHLPMLGDADDGYVVALAPQADFCPYRSLLATGASLFNRPDFFHKAKVIDDKTRWLLGNAVAQLPNKVTKAAKPVVRRDFAEGGYYLLGTDFDTANEIRCVVDCGPLGYLSIAAHGHADALSLTLFVSGQEFLIDPGTYAYHTKKAWRDYFRGTAAHNTIRVDGKDQSEPGGNFMWLRKANAHCQEWTDDDAGQMITARHDGYQRLPDSVTHERKVVFNQQSHRLLITDTLLCRGSHSIERFWHFSEDCEVSIKKTDVFVLNQGQSIIMHLSANNTNDVKCYKGSESPISGWVSRRFDDKTPTTTVVENIRISGETKLVAEIEFKQMLSVVKAS